MTQQRTFPENVSHPTSPREELDAHRPTHSEYEGGWWELACTGCDFAEGRRLSHLDLEPHHAHREEIFQAALLAAGYRKPRTITTHGELDALPIGSVVRDGVGRLWEWEEIGYGGVDKALSAMGIGFGLHLISFREFPATVLHEPVKP